MNYIYDNGIKITAMRRIAITSGAKLIPRGHCHFCGWSIGKGQLWCSSDCAKEYADEVKALAE